MAKKERFMSLLKLMNKTIQKAFESFFCLMYCFKMTYELFVNVLRWFNFLARFE